MAFPTIGGITIGGVQLSTDPATYEPVNWLKRQSVHMVVGGGTVIQDFGVVQKDNTLRLVSGRGQFIDEPTRAALFALYATKGATYTLTDWLGNVFTVFILDFISVPFLKGRDQSGTSISLLTYTMSLRTTGITTLFGTPYTGA